MASFMFVTVVNKKWTQVVELVSKFSTGNEENRCIRKTAAGESFLPTFESDQLTVLYAEIAVPNSRSPYATQLMKPGLCGNASWAVGDDA